MRRVVLSAVFFCATISPAHGQSDPSKPEFEAAEVKLNKANALERYERILPGGEVVARNIPVTEMITLAWDVPDEAIGGAPRWVQSDRFDVTAKAPGDTPDGTVRLMMRSLVEREFKIQVHMESRPRDVWVMTVGRNGVKMHQSSTLGKPDCKRSVTPESAAEAHCTNATSGDLTKMLQRLAPAYVDREVVDETGLTGAWDVNLNWVGKQVVDDGGPTMFEALDKQAGLRLDLKKRSMPFLVIDHIEKLGDN